MAFDQESRERTPGLDEFVQSLVERGASIVTLEKDVPVAAQEQGLVLRVTPQSFNENYPGLTWVEFDGRELLTECTIDNYGPPLGDDALIDVTPVYVSDDVGEPVPLEEGLKNVHDYLRGEDA